MAFQCPICGSEAGADKKEMVCAVCGKTSEMVFCENGHGLCDACRDDIVFEKIIAHCLDSESDDPYEIFSELVALDGVRMHDYKHHVIVGFALLTAHRNAGTEIDLESMLREMQKRGKKIPGGSCGFMGNCGAAVSTGTFLSILLGVDPHSEKNWGDVNLATAQALIQIGIIGGPRCCKRNSFAALRVGAQIACDKYGSNMKIPSDIKCQMSEKNSECIKGRCPFYSC